MTSTWNDLVDQFFDGYFRIYPTAGTIAGFHQYDAQLEDYSRAGVDNRIAWMKEWLDRFSKLENKSRSREQRQDIALLVRHLKGEMLETADIRSWEKDPDLYSSGIANSAFVIIARRFASSEERLVSLIARERQMPPALEAARENLRNPPKVYAEVAIEQMPGIIEFFQKDVPEAFKEVKNGRRMAEFNRVNAAVIDRLRQYQDFLKKDLLPASRGDFRIGEENYRKKLEYDEMVDLPLDRLLEIGYDDLRCNQREFRRVAAQVNPQGTPQQLLRDLHRDHPAPGRLLETFHDCLGDLRRYIAQHGIVTVPSPVPPIVKESPPFMRALSFASMDTPGPYEKVAKEAYFNVTLPEPEWSERRTESFLGQFNRFTMLSVAVHEVYPGHYVQFLWLPSAPSKVRKLLGCSSNAEGWAHYCEQMMLDEGYGDHDPKLRLGQLQDALLRNARYIVGISMHAGTMRLAEAVEFFKKEGYQPSAVAEIEARRGASDPTYLVYTLGKLEILKLRKDYQKKLGDKFSLREFHDTFLKQGFPPIRLIRETMLDDDGPVL
jgi:uncharacterized protein (DUF885 family)